MRKVLVSIAVSLFIAGISGGFVPKGSSLLAAEEPKRFQSVSPMEAKSLIEEKADLLLIDVRTPQEYQQGALPGSTLIPFRQIMRGNHELPKEKPILLVCAVGGRSYTVGQFLAIRGYREIYNLSGGLSAWAKQGVPLPVKPEKE